MNLHLDNGGEMNVRIATTRNLAAGLRDVGVTLNTRCGERGACKGCHVEIHRGQFRKNGQTIHVYNAEPCLERACQLIPVDDDGDIRVPTTSLLETAAQVDDAFAIHPFEHHPFIRKISVVLPLPAQGKGISDWNLLDNILRQELGDGELVEPDRELLADFSLLLAGSEDRRLGVTMEVRDGRGTILSIHDEAEDSPPILGLASDIGTTTVASLLVDLRNGEILDRASGYNQQISLADDVASRIDIAGTPEGTHELQRLVLFETLNKHLEILLKRTGNRGGNVHSIMLSGNTVMSHLLLGLSPRGIGQLPFLPVVRHYPTATAGVIGLAANRRAPVRVVPSIAGYVGGDLVSDIYTSGLLGMPGTTLLVDIGTNGEIILNDDGNLYGCATAAGPAFEGAGIHCGMRATRGAIEHLTIDADGTPHLEVIGDTRPLGLCGSAIVDFIAAAHHHGFINDMGRLDLDAVRKCGRYTSTNIATKDGRTVHAFLLAKAGESGTGHGIIVSEHDIAEVLKAKAAIYAGMKTLLASRGKSFRDVSKLILAGGFARHLDLISAVGIGLLPELERDRYLIVGNGSLAGAYLGLTEESAWGSFRVIADLPECIELNQCDEFEDLYVEALMIPNLEEDDFPGNHSPPGRKEP
ncbi:MAG: DUF4445 domain-containing protein [Candidatus Sumerlaeia bacterium]|nr:DUF4445 domain-containing protein [Candidatus Sumerlaeia bacterium]